MASQELPAAFFREEPARIARAWYDMAARFRRGGRLLSFGAGHWVTDAQHVAVEFVHPVIVGNRALPGLCLANDNVLLAEAPAVARDRFRDGLALLAWPDDVVGAFSDDGADEDVARGLTWAREHGLLTLAFCGLPGKGMAECRPDYLFLVSSCDPLLVLEVLETLVHVLYELVHVFPEEGRLP
ncbi:Phosphoheptose isomerase [Candidatus Hydrogenisulfobacillus filiaventi]|uniref:Phosphoheptose isomerase n=1 Tax=Candidatus Hydrogenisulfobacillus filiaventi TaxID=2707344 RepID=A0A6F8ZFR1_9FIRM|nr:Phosphoheptose isomerase [Candidatus Hydrogenisulfobacillus filiaventi]